MDAKDNQVIGLSEVDRKSGLRGEWHEQKAINANTPIKDTKKYYNQFSETGKMLWNIYEGRNHDRVKAFENRDIIELFHGYWRWVREACAERNILPSEAKVEFAITMQGDILLRLEKDIATGSS